MKKSDDKVSFFSIHNKLLISFLFFSFLITLLSGLIIYDLKNFYFIIVKSNQALPRFEALTELKNTASQIQFLTSNFNIALKNKNANRQAFQEILFAKIYELDEWYEQYTRKIDNRDKNLWLTLTQLKNSKLILTRYAIEIYQLTATPGSSPPIAALQDKLTLEENKIALYITQLLSQEMEYTTDQIKHTYDYTIKTIKFTAVFTLFSLIIAIILSLILSRLIAAPIIKLKDFAASLTNFDSPKSISLNSRDELGLLANSLNKMIHHLFESHQKLKVLASESIATLNTELIATARKAGMAEVATSVIHNVGNILNSINVSADLMLKDISESQDLKIQPAIDLLKQHDADLESFLKKDPKGMRIIEYLSICSTQLKETHDHLLIEIKSLKNNIEHVNNVISVQQSISKVGAIVESILPSDLFERCLLLHNELLIQTHVKIEKEYINMKPILIDKLQVEQILVNLIKNSLDSLSKSSADQRQITLLCVIDDAEKKVKFQVKDNGCGITHENLAKLFHFGFTTKPEGHGFGLHASILAANEMNGTLEAKSEGVDKGAEFTLVLPC